MLEDKIKELRNFGWSIDEIVCYCVLLYNSNPYHLWLFEKMTDEEMKSFVIDVILNII